MISFFSDRTELRKPFSSGAIAKLGASFDIHVYNVSGSIRLRRSLDFSGRCSKSPKTSWSGSQHSTNSEFLHYNNN